MLKELLQCIKPPHATAAEAFPLLTEADGQTQCKILEEVSVWKWKQMTFQSRPAGFPSDFTVASQPTGHLKIKHKRGESRAPTALTACLLNKDKPTIQKHATFIEM